MPVKTLTKFLDDNKVKYVTIRHSIAYTAQQIAESAHIPGKEMAVYVDEALTCDERIAFNAGSHSELIQLDYADFERLVQPSVANFSLG